MTTPLNSSEWQRLSPRMLLVHPIHEVLRQLPLLIGAFVLGSATDNPLWWVLGLGVIGALGVARWFTTTYRIGPEDVELRTGVLQRNALSVPRNRIRSVQTDARLLHRLLGLTVLRISTGQQARADAVFELDAVQAAQVPALRAQLLATANQARELPVEPTVELARWRPSWLRYSPLSVSGLVMIATAVGVLFQAGYGEALQDSKPVQAGLEIAARAGPVLTALVLAVGVLTASVLLAVGRSLLTYGNLVLVRRADTLHLTHGLLRVREHSYDMRRLRGGSLREPLLVRMFGGARLDAVMTGVGGAGESSLLLPPCPSRTAAEVLTGLVEEAGAASGQGVVSGPLVPHGPMAARRRWFRALALPAVLLVVLFGGALGPGVPGWVWPVWLLVVAASVWLAADRVRSLGHRVDDRWLVARSGSVERRRDCLQTVGIIGWTVRQTFFQRRAGVATLVAATAAGVKGYAVLDVPEEQAWAVAATASPWVAHSVWAQRPG